MPEQEGGEKRKSNRHDRKKHWGGNSKGYTASSEMTWWENVLHLTYRRGNGEWGAEEIITNPAESASGRERVSHLTGRGGKASQR